MDVTPLVAANQHIIQSYADGRFRVSGNVYEASVIVMPDRVIAWEFSGGVGDLSEDDFAPLVQRAETLDVVLLGCGKAMAFLPAPLRQALKERGLNIEVMDTGAACRTYNVLLAEGRRVAAVLLPFPVK
ncbi:MAG: Mth938-like domain-containing protein [Rhodospirillales bacterium]|nr:Mth938-like domain-containing protein [Rhodospirillales bacterium]